MPVARHREVDTVSALTEPRKPFSDPPSTLRITAVGDIMLDRRLQPPRVFHHQLSLATSVAGLTPPGIPYLNTEESRRWVRSRGVDIDALDVTAHSASSLPVELPAGGDAFDYPFVEVADELRRADLVFGNLECPLSDRGSRACNDACYCADPRFAEALAAVPFHVVSFANNHAMDFGVEAFHDTLNELDAHGIEVIGAGMDLEAARRPAVFERASTRVAFLAYNMVGPEETYACVQEPGVVPLNAMVVQEDVRRIRDETDLIVVSAHWGAELLPQPWPWLVAFAHELIDCGVDAVLGHHPHVPGSIEVYRGRPVFYSLGNFCFGHGHAPWGDNIMASLVIEEGRISWAEILPLTGTYQPRLLDDPDVEASCRWLADLSASFDTDLDYGDGRIWLRLR